jgi:hypothetical protein
LHERLIKTGARLVRHARYVIFQMAERALPNSVFAGILQLINGLRGPPAGALSDRPERRPERRHAPLVTGGVRQQRGNITLLAAL